MASVDVHYHGPIAELRLRNGVTNAIGRTLVDDLLSALEDIGGTASGMVLSGGEKFFCIGLDLPELLTLDRTAMSAFWDRLDRAVLALYELPIPTAAAVCAHATAGGAILALTCDFRYAASGRTLIGLNEIRIGVPVPFLADLMLKQVVGERTARDVAYGGDLMDAEAALDAGLVDRVTPKTEVEAAAREWIAELVERKGPAFSVVKAYRTEPIKRFFETHREARKQTLLDCWFRPDVQEMLREAAKKF